MNVPTIGRIVHITINHALDERPAIITRVVDDNHVGLCIFHDLQDAPGMFLDMEAVIDGDPGVYTRDLDGQKTMGRWHWPERP